MLGEHDGLGRADGQRGSILVAASVFLIVGLILLGSIQIGYMYYVKREMQKAADLAALTGVQSIEDGCAEASKAAKVSVTGNNNVGLADSDIAPPVCFFWQRPEDDDASDSGSETDEPLFPANALTVTLTKEASILVPFWDAGSSIKATATAVMDQPTAVFSVGSRLLALNSHGLLAGILKALDPGLSDSELSVLDSKGLANADIKLSGLLEALDLPVSLVTAAGTPEELADLSKVKLSKLLDVTKTIVLGREGGDVDVKALEDVVNLFTQVPTLGDKEISLLGAGGVFSLPTVDSVSALNASINVVNLIGTSVVVANGDNMVKLDLNDSSIPLLGDALQAEVQIVEPPSIGIGGIGTTASTAQVRLSAELSASEIPLVGGLLKLVGGGTNLKLPLTIEGTKSTGKLMRVCGSDGVIARNQAVIDVDSSLAEIKISPELSVGPITLIDTNVDLPIGGGSGSVTLTAPPGGPSSQTITPKLELISLPKAIADAVIGKVLNVVLEEYPTDADRSAMAQALVGSGKGNPLDKIADAVNESLNIASASLTQLSDRLSDLPLGFVSATLGDTVGAVGALVNSVVGVVDNLLHNLLDPIFGCNGLGGVLGGVHQCRVNKVQNEILNGANLTGVNSALVMNLLEPVLDPLGKVLNKLINNLGLNLSQTDVNLYSVNCGGPHLVQ